MLRCRPAGCQTLGNGASLLMRRSRRLIAPLAVTAALVIVPALAYAATTTISMSGATASFPLITLLTSKYTKLR